MQSTGTLKGQAAARLGFKGGGRDGSLADETAAGLTGLYLAIGPHPSFLDDRIVDGG